MLRLHSENQKFEIGKGKVNKTTEASKETIIGKTIENGYPTELLLRFCMLLDISKAVHIKYDAIAGMYMKVTITISLESL